MTTNKAAAMRHEFDEHCEELARYWLEERGATVVTIHRLARRIQTAIEEFIEDDIDAGRESDRCSKS